MERIIENLCRHNARMYPVAYILYLKTLNAKLDKLEVEIANFQDSLRQFMTTKQRLMVLCDHQNITVHTMQLLDEENREHKRLSHEMSRVNAALTESQINKTRELVDTYKAWLFSCNDDDEDGIWNNNVKPPLSVSNGIRQKLDAL